MLLSRWGDVGDSEAENLTSNIAIYPEGQS